MERVKSALGKIGWRRGLYMMILAALIAGGTGMVAPRTHAISGTQLLIPASYGGLSIDGNRDNAILHQTWSAGGSVSCHGTSFAYYTQAQILVCYNCQNGPPYGGSAGTIAYPKNSLSGNEM